MLVLNRKGFTLVEVLAVIVVIALVVGIAVPNVVSSIRRSKDRAEEIMIENIKTASYQMYDEVVFSGTVNANGDIVSDLLDGGNNIKILKDTNSIQFHFQALVDNGFLPGSGKDDEEMNLINPNTNVDLGSCYVKIMKCGNDDYAFDYLEVNNICPDLDVKNSC